MFAQSNGTESGGDLISDVGSELKVTLDRWSAGQVGLVDVVVALGVVATAAGAAWVIRRVISRGTRHWEGVAATAAVVVGQLASGAVYLLAVAIVLEVLGFSLGPVLIIALLAVLVVLLLRPLVQNLSSGLLLQLRGPFGLGDLIETNDIVGTVEQVNTRTVVVVTGDGRTVSVPNDHVLAGSLVNYSAMGRRRSELTFRLAGAVDLDPVTRAIREAVGEVSSVVDDPSAEVVLTGLDGAQLCVAVLFWHAPGFESERAARDGVSRAIVESLSALEVPLADHAMEVSVADSGLPAREPHEEASTDG